MKIYVLEIDISDCLLKNDVEKKLLVSTNLTDNKIT